MGHARLSTAKWDIASKQLTQLLMLRFDRTVGGGSLPISGRSAHVSFGTPSHLRIRGFLRSIYSAP
jgi:hypothetical protein